MAYSIGTPVVGANIVTATNAVQVSNGTVVTIKEMRGAAEREVSGTVIGIELGNKPFYGMRAHEIYDGIPVSTYKNEVATMIKNAADVMEVNALLIEVAATEEGGSPTHVRVNVGRIKEIAADQAGGGDGTDEDTGTEEDETTGA